MPELHLQRIDDTLMVRFGDYSASIPFADVAPSETIGERIRDDATAYGRDLFDKAFRDAQLQTLLTDLRANERLVLVADDPPSAAIPWEYLRDQNNKLLASRLNFVRGISEAQRHENFPFTSPLEIVAIPVSPVDEPRVLNVEREWKNLIEAVTITNPRKSLTLKRVRPPTRSELESSLDRQCTSIVHFMGHSTSRDGKAFLAFEDARARTNLIDAIDFADSLNNRVFLVVLNSCLSAFVATTDPVITTTEFGNIARALVYQGVPYAIGMQFNVSDDAALVLSEALYTFLLQKHSIEEAVMHTRRTMEEPGKLSNAAWLAGIPVLYTCLRTPAPPIALTLGQPTIDPDPTDLQKTCDLTALPQATHFVGRSAEISEALDALLAPRPADFVVLHGLGGSGKTSLARVVAERASYHYRDQVLAVSFETFADLHTEGEVIVDEYFAGRFYNQLVHFYNLDPAIYKTPADLQRAILQKRILIPSLLVLDNIETLIDAQMKKISEAKSLATFISRLKEGDGAILLTSRIVPPSDWGNCKIIPISGLDDEAGGSLFLSRLPRERQAAALPMMHKKLSQRVNGNPLSILLLSGCFAEATTTLETFLTEIDAGLQTAEQATPTSLEDPGRHATLYACMDYSIKRLTPELLKVLNAVSLFRAPFPPSFAASLLDNEEQVLLHLQDLVGLSLLDSNIIQYLPIVKEGRLRLLNLQPTLRWYINYYQPMQDADLIERYCEIYEQLTIQSMQDEGGYDQSSLIRYLVRQSLPDYDAALEYLPSSARRSILAYQLAQFYHRFGQNGRARDLYEQALEINQELGESRSVALTQSALADALSLLGEPQKALEFYEQSLRTAERLGDSRGVAIAQSAIAHVLWQVGKPQEALTRYELALRTVEQLGDSRGVSVTQSAMADVLSQLGKPQEALSLYEQALRIQQQLGDIRNVATTQSAMADVLSQLGKPQEALSLYEQALRIQQQFGESRGVAVTQHAKAGVLSLLGKPQEALSLYEQSLHTAEQLGDIRSVAVTQSSMADVLIQLDKPQEALSLYEQSLHTLEQLGDSRGMAIAQRAVANVLWQVGKPQEALTRLEQTLRTVEQLGDIQEVAVTQEAIADVLSRLGKPQEALTRYEQSLHTEEQLGNSRGVAATRGAMANVLCQVGKLQEALTLYQQALSIQQQLGESRSMALTQSAMADALSHLGKPQEALTRYEQALHIFQELDDSRGVSVTEGAIADVLCQLGKPQEALAFYEQALRTQEQLGDSQSVAVTQHAMANVLSQLGKPQEALALYQQSLRTSEQLGDIRSVSVTQGAMADVLRELGRPQEALALYRLALRAVEQLGDVHSVAAMQCAMAGALRQLGNPLEALLLYQQALDTQEQLGDSRGVAATQHNIASVLLLSGDTQDALKLLEKALRTEEQLGDSRGVAVIQGTMANVLREMSKPQEALDLYKQVLYTTEQLGDSRGVAVIQGAMADVFCELGKPQEALALYERALRTQKQLGDIQSMAVTQVNFGQFLLDQGEYHRALAMIWDAYTSLRRHGFSSDAQDVQHLLRMIKGRRLDPTAFDMLWKQVVSEPQPEWL
jgi:tetratricopeptide (TPR) repeat protein